MHTKPTKNQIKSCVAQLTIVSFFPSEPLKQALIMRFFQQLVGTNEQLEWLVSVLLTVDWPGPAQVRALFCTRFPPADGIKEGEQCRLSGFTPNDCEAHRSIAAPDLKLLSAPEKGVALDAELIADMNRLEAKCKLQAARERGKRSTKKYVYIPPDWLK